MSAPEFRLPARQFWTQPWEEVTGFSRRLLEERWSGLVLAAPDLLPLEIRDTLPVIVFHSGSDDEMAQAPFEGLAVVVAVHLDSNTVRAAVAIEEVSPPRPRAPRPRGFLGSFLVRDLHLELFQRLPLIPPRRGEYLLQVLLRDRQSNRVRIRMLGAPAGHEDQAPGRLVQAGKGTPRVLRIWPAHGRGLVRYHGHDSPLPPPDAGIALQTERVVVSRPEARGLLRVSFRLPVSSHDVFEPPVLLEPDAADAPQAPPVTAIVSLTLLILGSDRAAPVLLPVSAPVFEAPEGDHERPVVAGQFEVDLLQLEAVAGFPQTYFVYACSGECIAGPAAMAVLHEKDLPT